MPADDAETRSLLARARTIAVVGLSEKRERDSNRVAKYLQAHGYRILPVNPNVTEVLGERAYPDISSIPSEIRVDIVDVFRRREEVGPIVEQAIRRQVPTVWMQLGVENARAAKAALQAGIRIYENLCIMQEHRRLTVPPPKPQE